MFKYLKLTVCSAAVTSASFSPAGAFGYGAVIALTAVVLSALGGAIWRSLLQAGRDRSQFELLDMRVARRGSERTFNPLSLFATSNMGLSNKPSTIQEHRHVQA
jgi:hypothetical protein